jgi:phosphate transport system substrate-binding protein
MLNRIFLFILLLITSVAYAETDLTGAGSTFIDPVLSKWTEVYAKHTKVKINYQSIGSGGGIQQLTNKTVDFAASDMPLDIAVLNQKHWKQFPMIIGGIVMVVNIDGIKSNQLILDGSTLANIYLGKITQWNDPAIQSLNPTFPLPNARIIVVHRADGSGTTFNFTHYLASVNPEFKNIVGVNTLVSFPGFSLGAKGNAGVAAQVIDLADSIGYVEYAFAMQNQMATVEMKNADGNVIKPSAASFAAAAKSAPWQASNGFNLVLTNQSGKNSWPIVATTFILLPAQTSNNQAATQASLTFFKWAYEHGQSMAASLDYVSIPDSTVKLIEASW